MKRKLCLYEHDPSTTVLQKGASGEKTCACEKSFARIQVDTGTFCMESAQYATMPLSVLEAGASACVWKLRGQQELTRRMTELGFVVGTELKVLSGFSGDLIVELKGARMAMNRQMAGHVIVTRMGGVKC